MHKAVSTPDSTVRNDIKIYVCVCVCVYIYIYIYISPLGNDYYLVNNAELRIENMARSDQYLLSSSP